MSFFEGVPNEIMTQIINETSAGDIWSLASCCKRFSALAQKRLEFHRKKRARAKQIIVGELFDKLDDPLVVHTQDDLAGQDRGLPPIIHPSKYLQDILEYDDRRFYTKVLRIGSLEIIDQYDGAEGHEEGALRLRANAKLVADVETQFGHKVTALVANVYSALLRYLGKYGVKEWTHMIKEGNSAAVTLLLLTLYPNLETLEIYEPEETWSNEEMWGDLLLGLISIAKRPDINKLRIFSRASVFVLRGHDMVTLEARLQLAVPFMELPTMRKIFGVVVDGRRVQWTAGVGTSGVTHLNFTGDIDGASLSSLIRGSKALESFNFELSPDRDWGNRNGEIKINSLRWGPQAEGDAACKDLDRDKSNNKSCCAESKTEADRPRWEPRGIVANLLLFARHSLVSLELTAANLAGVVKFSNDEPFIGSLRSFRALKLVHLDTMMLFKKLKCSSNASVVLGKSKQQTLWENMRPYRLMDFLPVTIEKFGMTSRCVGQGLWREDVVEMFTGLPEGRSALPKLFVIKVKWRDDGANEKEKDGWQELRERCEKNDIVYWS